MVDPPILPAAYLPPVTYFFVLSRNDEVFIESQETYPKQTLRNRCTIYTAHGPGILTVPVSKPRGNSTKTSEVLISYRRKWKDNHWRAITSAYNRSPYFFFIRDHLENTFFTDHKTLLDFDMALLQALMEMTGTRARVTLTSEFQRPESSAHDLRYGKFFGVAESEQSLPSYPQVFSEKHGFQPDLSILDLLCNLGPATGDYLSSLDEKKLFTRDIRS